MTITSVDKNYDTLSVDVIADFTAPIEAVWQLWADPRKLERWWGPPTWPATVEEHDLSVGGRVNYFMTGPDGEKAGGWWTITAVNPPTSLSFTDGFADPDGNPIDSLPTMQATMELSQHNDGTRMVMRSVYASKEDLDTVVEMGMLEGIRGAAGQMDAILAEAS